MKTLIKPSLLSVVLSTALLASAPVAVFAQAAAPATAAKQATASQVVLASSTRILTTLDQRRAEFKSNPAALRQFVQVQQWAGFWQALPAPLQRAVSGRSAPRQRREHFARLAVGIGAKVEAIEHKQRQAGGVLVEPHLRRQTVLAVLGRDAAHRFSRDR